jgi:hypothetical protein
MGYDITRKSRQRKRKSSKIDVDRALSFHSSFIPPSFHSSFTTLTTARWHRNKI